uniref:NADH-ubiquinone oxidoreductase chain 3 n=1 Tax=Neelides sp. FZ-2019 TaxID=2583951 RepID=A0A6H0EVQ0_9HEXA|nr:NADH dehydrogenase subunit 3 [Neelides sp. FZ-2019]
MKCMISMIIMILSLGSILILLNSLIGTKNAYSKEKMSPFECGFEPHSSARLFFSMRFYLIAIIFLIFDIELTLIIPVPFSINLEIPSYPIILMITFMTILILGLIHEWMGGALEWTK